MTPKQKQLLKEELEILKKKITWNKQFLYYFISIVLLLVMGIGILVFIGVLIYVYYIKNKIKKIEFQLAGK